MAVNFVGGTQNQTELEKIQQELYAESFTIRDGLIEIDEGHKSGTDSYESKVSVVISDANRGAVVATGNITAVTSVNGCTGILGITGTTGEIEVTNTCPNIIIGLPNNITISGNLNVGGDIQMFGSIYIDGGTF